MPSFPPFDNRITQAERIWLFLDYDGTVAEFTPTPDMVQPRPQVVELLSHLVKCPRFRVAVVSGRRLGHVRQLVPVPGIVLAGTYGIELQMAHGERTDRLDLAAVRPTLDLLKPRWGAQIEGRTGFLLEDKGWALAIHARFAMHDEAEVVLSHARHTAVSVLDAASPRLFRLLGGHKFLEVVPAIANKGLAVAYLLDHNAWRGALPIYLGDDDKDEEAFAEIKSRRGVALVVAAQPRRTEADYRLESPQAARHWLQLLLAHS